jgi:hypothetical protein
MNRTRVFILSVLLGFGVAPAAADGATAGPSAEELSLEGFGAKTPACLEWSDGCAVCARDDRQAAHCSTPGIACQPGPIACRAERPK